MKSIFTSIIFRYFILLAIGLEYFVRGYNSIFYTLATKLTLLTTFIILKLIYAQAVSLILPNTLAVLSIQITLVPACIGGAAYFLLVALNLCTSMSIKTRISNIILLIITFFALNVIRIVTFSIIAINNINLFDLSHFIFWYLGSTIMVVAIWFVFNKNNTSIPAYTDIKSLISTFKK